MGLSLAGVLAADTFVACLVQIVLAIRGGHAASPWYSFLFLSIWSLVIVIPAWLCWLPAIYFFQDPLRTSRPLFLAIGILWGAAFTYALRFGSILRHPARWLPPTILDGVALAVSSFSTLFYLLLLEHFSASRIQMD